MKLKNNIASDLHIVWWPDGQEQTLDTFELLPNGWVRYKLKNSKRTCLSPPHLITEISWTEGVKKK